MKITARQREILTHIAEHGHAPHSANAAIRNRMMNTLGLYTAERAEDGTWSEVLTDKGREALA